MKKLLTIICVAILMMACGSSEQQLKERAAELCQYIPDHELKEVSKDYMTPEFYNVLDTLFNHLPEHEAMDHEWLYYFVTGNGGTIADFEVAAVEQTDKTHAIATIMVRQKWEDGSMADDTDVEEHKMEMELVDGQWLIADFDGHKQDCIRHIEINRKEQAVRKAISAYIEKEVAPHYLKGQLCIPTLLIASEEKLSDSMKVWLDAWIYWYNISGDTLKTVSGGNHSGCMTLTNRNGNPTVASFEQTLDGAAFLPSAKRIFNQHFDVFQNMHSNQDVREAARKEQLSDYLKEHQLNIRYYQDYGWPATPIE